MDPTKYYPEKHVGLRTTDAGNYNPGATDIKLIRVPELYLILAESYLEEGDSGSGIRVLKHPS